MTAALLAAALGASPAAAQAPLQMPPPSAIAATFRVDVQAPRRVETVLDALRRELAANPRPEHSETPLPGGAVRASGIDVLPAILGLARQVQRARRERSARRIHDEVSAELAAFCDVNDCSAANEGLLLPDKP